MVIDLSLLGSLVELEEYLLAVGGVCLMLKLYMRYPKRNSQSSEVEFDASEGEFSKHHCEGLQSSLSLALVLELGSSGCFDDNPSS